MKIQTTTEFDKAYEYIFTCARDVYSQSILSNFRKAFGKKLKLLEGNPLLGSIEPSLEFADYEYRNLVIKPFFKIIYIIYEGVIYLTDIWDTRRDPSLLTKNYN